MMRLNLILLLAVLISALTLVKVQYRSRWLYAELDNEQSLYRRLSADNERLKVDIRSLATSNRIERIAKSQLQMHPASPAVTTYVNDQASARHTP